MKWLAVVAVLLLFALGRVTVLKAQQSAPDYDWCWLLDTEDMGAASMPGTGGSVMNWSYTADRVINPSRVELDIYRVLYNSNPTQMTGRIEVFGVVGLVNGTAPANADLDLAVNAPGPATSGTLIHLEWQDSSTAGLQVQGIRVYGNGQSPFGIGDGWSDCMPRPQDNDLPFDWCHEFDLREFNPFAVSNGYYQYGKGIVSDQNGYISLSFDAGQVISGYSTKFDAERLTHVDAFTPNLRMNVVAAGDVFGIPVSASLNLPEIGRLDNYFTWSATAQGAPVSGATINVTIQGSSGVVLRGLQISGLFRNPFGANNCPGLIDGLPNEPTSTHTPLPTSLPSETPGPTETPTATATATNTPAPTPTWSPTPTPTPTAHYYLGPIQSRTGSSKSAWDYSYLTFLAQPNAIPVGFVLTNLDIGNAPAGEQSLGGNSLPLLTPPISPPGVAIANPGWYEWVPEPGAVVPTQAANMVRTAYPGAGILISEPNPIAVGTTVAEYIKWGCCNSTPNPDSVFVGRFVLLGWPTITPTPTNTPTVTRTPTITRTPGPTFTPNPNATATRTPTRTPYQVGPPATTNPLPTSWNWMTPSGTYSVIGTPGGGGFGTPTPVVPTSTGTPGATSTPYTTTPTPMVTGTGTPVGIEPMPSDLNNVTGMGEDVFGLVNGLLVKGRDWLAELLSRTTGIYNMWRTAPVTAPPGVPLCATQPTQNEFCAILYIIRYTILSGPVGSLIMPLATIVFDLFIVFLFIRMARAILARLSKVTDV